MDYNFTADFENSKKKKSFDAIDFKKVGDVKFYKMKESFNTIDIVPFVIKSKDHPLVYAGKKKVGDVCYNLNVWTHSKVGPGNLTVICPKKTYGKPCPICDVASEYYKQGAEKKKEYDATKAKNICYYNIIDCDHPDEGLKVWNVSFYLFEEDMVDKALNGQKDGTIITFPDPKNGYTIEFRGIKQSGGGYNYTKGTDFTFTKREENLEKWMKKAVSFDEFITVLSADQLEALLNGAGAEEEDEEERMPVQEEPVETKVEESQKEEPKDTNQCPYDHEWGVDNDTTPDCEKCRAKNMKIWKECFRAQ